MAHRTTQEIIDDHRHMTRTVARLVKVALLARGAGMTRGELHQLINASRPGWPITIGELSEALRALRDADQVKITIASGQYFDNSENQIAMIGG